MRIFSVFRVMEGEWTLRDSNGVEVVRYTLPHPELLVRAGIKGSRRIACCCRILRTSLPDGGVDYGDCRFRLHAPRDDSRDTINAYVRNLVTADRTR